MILGVYISGLIVSIVGIAMRAKAAYLAGLLWMMDIILWVLGKTTTYESIAQVIISVISIVLTLFWIIRVNKIMGGGSVKWRG